MGEKTFPAFPVHAQPTILYIWQEAHGNKPQQNTPKDKLCIWLRMWVFRKKWKHDLFFSVNEIRDVDHLCSQLFSLSVWFVPHYVLANTTNYFLLTIHTIPKCFVEFQCQVVKSICFFPSQENLAIMTSRKLHCVHLQSIWTKTKHYHWFWIRIK